jgi:hypothetical protein
MDKSGAEDKPQRGRWERRNFQWKSRFEYFDQTGRCWRGVPQFCYMGALVSGLS